MFSLVTRFLLIATVIMHSLTGVHGHCCVEVATHEHQEQHAPCQPSCLCVKDDHHFHLLAGHQHNKPCDSVEPVCVNPWHHHCNHDCIPCQCFAAVVPTKIVKIDVRGDRGLDKIQVYLALPCSSFVENYDQFLSAENTSFVSVSKMRLHLFLGHFLI